MRNGHAEERRGRLWRSRPFDLLLENVSHNCGVGLRRRCWLYPRRITTVFGSARSDSFLEYCSLVGLCSMALTVALSRSDRRAPLAQATLLEHLRPRFQFVANHNLRAIT